MATATQLKALFKSIEAGDEERLYSVALQIAAHEARRGHEKVAKELRDLIDSIRQKHTVGKPAPAPVPLAQPRGELAGVLSVSYPSIRLRDVILAPDIERRLKRAVHEQRQHSRLAAHGLRPRSKLLLVGPPGSGKTLTGKALAGELKLPLFSIMLDGLITKFMGETAAKLRLVFDAIKRNRGVYLFDEFDAIGSQRTSVNDVGEIRRVLNSFLYFLEEAEPTSVIVAATNHPELLDPALFRRFDDVLEYSLPNDHLARIAFTSRLGDLNVDGVSWKRVIAEATGLSYAEILKACEDAAKEAVLSDEHKITTESLLEAIRHRKQAIPRVRT
jgi:SpoVK/Ycf46/Vps4 family AAA+-type ATPase